MVSSPKGFFAALYDFSFHTFITPRIVQIVYLLWLLGVALWALIFLVSGLAPQPSFFGEQSFSAFSVVLRFIGAAVIFVGGSITARISLEFVTAVFRIAENTEVLRRDQHSV